MGRAAILERAEGPAAAGLPFTTLTRVFLRSLLLQASWNRRGMQNLGFAYAMWPALCALYADRAARERALSRHLAVFNTHPYLAAAILGGALHHEIRVARAEAPAESVERFKQALMGPLAAVGDSFYWLSLRPFAGAAAAVLAPQIGLWSVALFLALYNVPHFWLRVLLFVRGVQGGDRVVESVARAGLPRKGARLRRASAALGGSAGALSALLLSGHLASGDVRVPLLMAVPAAALVFLISYRLLQRRGPVLVGWAAALVGLLLAILTRSS
jgi:PTS system mannose-specific IID component